jgi:anti-sigma factor RsiW
VTSDEARDRFGDALDGSLSADEKSAFEAAIAADGELADELELYRKIAVGAAGLGARSSQPPAETSPGTAPGLGDAIPPPDFLPRVQARIRKNTRGRYFRDRNADTGAPRTAATMALVVLTILVLIAAAIYVHQRFIDVEVPEAPTAPTAITPDG